MGAAGIEIPEWLNGRLFERVYERAKYLRDRERSNYSRRMVEQGLRRAKDQDPRMLKLLDHGANYLQHRNDEQKSRFAQEGFSTRNTEFSEFSSWREAFILASEPRSREDTKYGVHQWIYAAAAEAL